MLLKTPGQKVRAFGDLAIQLTRTVRVPRALPWAGVETRRWRCKTGDH